LLGPRWETVLFVPLLGWAVAEVLADGVGYLLACGPNVIRGECALGFPGMLRQIR
jgi:hypothetical protein